MRKGPDVPLLKRAYDRAVGMAKDGVVSASALDDAEKNYELALNKQNVAKAQVTVLEGEDCAVRGHRWRKTEPNLTQLEETAELHGYCFSDRWHRALARCGNGRRGKLESWCWGSSATLADDAGRYQ